MANFELYVIHGLGMTNVHVVDTTPGSGELTYAQMREVIADPGRGMLNALAEPSPALDSNAHTHAELSQQLGDHIRQLQQLSNAIVGGGVHFPPEHNPNNPRGLPYPRLPDIWHEEGYRRNVTVPRNYADRILVLQNASPYFVHSNYSLKKCLLRLLRAGLQFIPLRVVKLIIGRLRSEEGVNRLRVRSQLRIVLDRPNLELTSHAINSLHLTPPAAHGLRETIKAIKLNKDFMVEVENHANGMPTHRVNGFVDECVAQQDFIELLLLEQRRHRAGVLVSFYYPNIADPDPDPIP